MMILGFSLLLILLFIFIRLKEELNQKKEQERLRKKHKTYLIKKHLKKNYTKNDIRNSKYRRYARTRST